VVSIAAPSIASRAADGKAHGNPHAKFAVALTTRYVFIRMARYYSGKNQPLGHWNNLPIYLTTILTALLVAGLIISAVLTSAGSSLLAWFIFQMPLEPAWSVWRFFSYVIIGQVSFFTPFSILFFYWLSVGLETHLGRPKLGWLLTLVTLTTPAVSAFWWWGLGVPSHALDNYMLMSGLLVAFATLYPQTEAWGWVPFKWVAFACIVCGSLMLLADRRWLEISQLWASCAVGFAYIHHAKELEYDDYQSPLLRLKHFFRAKPKLRVLPSPRAEKRRVEAAETPADLDALLDKIAKSGMASLTTRERAQLEKAREALMRKDQR
jgi:hypothetical protein